MSTLNVRLPEDLERRLAREAQTTHRPRSELAREAIHTYLAQREKERFLGELTQAAQRIAQDPKLRRDAVAIAEEYALVDEEAWAQLGSDDENGNPWWR